LTSVVARGNGFDGPIGSFFAANLRLTVAMIRVIVQGFAPEDGQRLG